ncbi:MAG: hypothetical protein U0269_23215 [Polyangiales bacterium]
MAGTARVRGVLHPLALVALASASCAAPAQRPWPLSELRCPVSASEHCASAGCPANSRQICDFLRSRGGSSYGGPIACDAVGTGYDFFDRDRSLRVLFDSADRVVAVIDITNEASPRCLGGPPVLPATGCSNGLLLYTCTPLGARDQ